jgi:cell division protease FtsH
MSRSGRHELESSISVLIGGRASEVLIFDGEISTGAPDDLQRATDRLRKAMG